MIPGIIAQSGGGGGEPPTPVTAPLFNGDVIANTSYADGNATFTKSNNSWRFAWSDQSFASGKIYAEFIFLNRASTSSHFVGFALNPSSHTTDYLSGAPASCNFVNTGGATFIPGNAAAGETTIATGYNLGFGTDDIRVGIAFDIDAKKWWIRRCDTGAWLDGDPAAGTGGYTWESDDISGMPAGVWYLRCGAFQSGASFQLPQIYQVAAPSGFTALGPYS